MNEKEIVIPEGWTYFAHRTNTERWNTDPFTIDVIITNKLMSVVTEKDIYQEVRHYGIKKPGYTSGKGIPFEIRSLICELPYLRSMEDDFDMKNIMLNEFYYDKRNLGGARGARHHSIPKDEELVVLGIGKYNEVTGQENNIILTIPRRFMGFYRDEVQKSNNTIIPLEKRSANLKIDSSRSK